MTNNHLVLFSFYLPLPSPQGVYGRRQILRRRTVMVQRPGKDGARKQGVEVTVESSASAVGC